MAKKWTRQGVNAGIGGGTSAERRPFPLRPLCAALLLAATAIPGQAAAAPTPYPVAIPASAHPVPAVGARQAGDQPLPRTEIYLIDAGVADADILRRAVPAGAEVVFLSPDRSGIGQIATLLQGRSGVDALHIISHGGAGYLRLGSDILSPETLDHHRATLSDWRPALAEGADILLYGCEVAASAEGRQLVAEIGRITGTDLAASVDLTGAAGRRGNWELEHHAGRLETAALQAPGYPATLATITVDSTADDILANKGCTLREAIIAANSDAAYNGCAAGAGDDTIEFDGTVFTGSPTLITLGSALPLIDTGIAIDGDAGSAATIHAGIDGDGNSGIFRVASSGRLALSRLDLRNGYVSGSGGAIHNQGDLVVDGVRFANNSAYFFGGAIENLGTASIGNQSLFAGNSVAGWNDESAGGAIDNYGGTLAVVGSRFTGNAAYSYWSGSYGGAIANSLGSVATIDGSVFIDNGAFGYYWAYGGAVDNRGTLELGSSYFYGNLALATEIAAGGGLAGTGTTVATDSDFVYNSAIIYFPGNYGRPGENRRAPGVHYGNAFGGGVANLGGSLDLFGADLAYNATLGLAQFYYYGGYRGERSPAFKARRQGDRGYFSYYFLYGAGGGLASLAGGSTRVLSSPTRSSFVYWNYANAGGGALNYGSDLYIRDTEIVGNYSYVGGGIANVGSLDAPPSTGLTLTESLVYYNLGLYFGGGIANLFYGQASVRSSELIGNGSILFGAGAANYGLSTLEVQDSTIQWNYVWYNGGGISSYGSELSVSGSTFYGNYAYFGGGLALSGSSAKVANSTFSGNFTWWALGDALLQVDYSPALRIAKPPIRALAGGLSKFAAGNRSRRGEPPDFRRFSRSTPGAATSLVNSTLYGGGGWYRPAHLPDLSRKRLTKRAIQVKRPEFDRAAYVGHLRNAVYSDTQQRVYDGLAGTLLAAYSFYGGSQITIANTLVGEGTDGNCLFYGVAPVVVSSLNDDRSCTGFGQVADLGLAGLADNGGATYTHALLAGSPAVNAGTDSAATDAGLATDQRGAGFPRRNDKQVDVGAVESMLSAPLQPGLSVTPSLYDFGDLPVAVPGPEATFTLTNSGNAPAVVNGITSSNPDVFAVTSDQCSGATLPMAGGSCTFGVTMTPPGVAYADAAGEIITTPGVSPLGLFYVFGYGVAEGVLVFTPPALEFAPRPIDTTSEPQVVSLRNIGTAPVLFGNLGNVPAGTRSIDGDFALAADTCSNRNLAIGEQCQVGVTFTPTATGPRTGTLAIPSNAFGSPHLVGLNGGGLPIGFGEPKPIPLFGWMAQLLSTLLLGGLAGVGLRRLRRAR